VTDDNLKKALEITKSAVAEAGDELIKHYGNIDAETKSTTGQNVTDIVTKLDRQTEDFLAFRGEESGVRSEAEVTWLVDPIDGTSHFVRGLPFCTTMVALIEDHQVLMSVIYDFVHRDTYWAIKGYGAYKNDEPIHVSSRPLSLALLSYETKIQDSENLKTYMKVREKSGLISTINCGFEFSAIASGKLEGRLAKNGFGEDWDYAPGSLLVAEAGGVATNMGSVEYDYRNHDYLITNAVVHAELTSGPDAIFPVLD
jgi:myo-inositol-1(or 4)-monophosphatase